MDRAQPSKIGFPAGLALRAAALGLASGGRSTAGLAAMVASCHPADQSADLPLRALSAPARWVAAAMVMGELVADKLPATPSRMQLPALVGRLATGALSAGALDQRYRTPLRVPVALGGIGALIGSAAGLRWRQAVAARDQPDLPAALGEDALVLALARWATLPAAR